jgi:hypothetical protein
MIYTNSELESWLHCKRCWWLGYYRKLRPVREVRSPLTVGSLYHYAMESYYRGVGDPVDVIRIRATGMIEAHPDFARDIAKDAELAGIMAQGYMEWLEETGEDADLEVYAAEEKIDVPLGETGHTLRGKLDARAIHRSSGARLFLEHKTVQNLADLPKTAQTNHQFLTYSLLELLGDSTRYAPLQETAERTDGVLLNMARKVKRTSSAKPPFYGRVPIRYNVDEIRNHFRHLVAITGEIDRARTRLDAGESHQYVVPPTSTRDCYWRCSFSSVCMSGMIDNGGDWESYLLAGFEECDPLARYEEEEGDAA